MSDKETEKLVFVAFRGKSLISKGIRFVTRSKHYSHIGFLNENGVLVECWPTKANPFQRWLRSELTNHKPGTKFEHWALRCSAEERGYVSMGINALGMRRTKYSWLGCLGFVLKSVKKRPGRMFCSEGCIAPLVSYRNWSAVTPGHVSPQDFVELLQAAGAVMTYDGEV